MVLNIVVDDFSVEISKRGMITGGIYIQMDDLYFPEMHWNDFIVVILQWWNKSADMLIEGPIGTTVEFNFIAGSYYIRGTKEDELNVELAFIRRYADKELLINSYSTNVFKFKRSIVQASEKLFEAVRAKEWKTDDIDALMKAL